MTAELGKSELLAVVGAEFDHDVWWWDVGTKKASACDAGLFSDEGCCRLCCVREPRMVVCLVRCAEVRCHLQARRTL